jgi:hypothetical protein
MTSMKCERGLARTFHPLILLYVCRVSAKSKENDAPEHISVYWLQIVNRSKLSRLVVKNQGRVAKSA